MNSSIIALILLGVIIINQSDAKSAFWEQLMNAAENDEDFLGEKRAAYISIKTVARCTSIIQGKDYLGGDMDVTQPAQVRSPAACAALCEEYPTCNYWTLDTRNGNCFIKNKQPTTYQTLSFTYTGACNKS